MDTAREISAAQACVRLNTDRDGCFHSACNSSGHEGDPLGRVNLDWVNWGISFRGVGLFDELPAVSWSWAAHSEQQAQP
jgi:hypothetical protein